MRNPVTTHKRKYDGTEKAPWAGDLVEALGDSWLVVYYESPRHTAAGGTAVAHALRYFGLDQPLSVLVCFDAVGNVLEYQCDAGLPATIEGRRISFVDLDLDVMAGPDLAWHERDHEVFAERTRTMSYPPKVVAAAHEGVRLAKELIAARALPFDGHPERVLGRVLAATGPL